MTKLITLPDGDYVDPARVSSVEVIYPKTDQPQVVVRTIDGARFEMPESSFGKNARKARDELADQLNQLR
jgi:hypothetical protein